MFAPDGGPIFVWIETTAGLILGWIKHYTVTVVAGAKITGDLAGAYYTAQGREEGQLPGPLWMRPATREDWEQAQGLGHLSPGEIRRQHLRGAS